MSYGHPIAPEAGAAGSGARRRVHATRPAGHRSSTTADALPLPLRRSAAEPGDTPNCVALLGQSRLRSRRACARRDTRRRRDCEWPRRTRCAPAGDQNGNPQRLEPSRTIRSPASQRARASRRDTCRCCSRATGTTRSRGSCSTSVSARAHHMLSNPLLAERTISTIAYEAGFGDLSHFNRAFRRRYGETPSDVRARGHDTRLGDRRPGGFRKVFETLDAKSRHRRLRRAGNWSPQLTARALASRFGR